MKETVFHPAIKKVIRAFPKTIKLELGKAIRDLEKGFSLSMPLSRPMNTIARGVEEIRLKGASGIYRVFYYVKLKDKILIFHAFQKKTRTTSKQDKETGKSRLKDMLL